jgi:hypothetical protein
MQRPNNDSTQVLVLVLVPVLLGKVIWGSVGKVIPSDFFGDGEPLPVSPAESDPVPLAVSVDPAPDEVPVPEAPVLAGVAPVVRPGTGTADGSVGSGELCGDVHGWHGTGPRSSTAPDFRQLQLTIPVSC